MNTYKTVIQLQGYDFWVEFDYTEIPFVKGHRDHGEQIDPDEPASVEIEEIRMCNDPDSDNGKYFKTELPDIVIEGIKQDIMGEYQ